MTGTGTGNNHCDHKLPGLVSVLVSRHSLAGSGKHDERRRRQEEGGQGVTHMTSALTVEAVRV